MRKFAKNGLENFPTGEGELRIVPNRITKRRTNLRVTIKPSMLKPKEFKVKNERL